MKTTKVKMIIIMCTIIMISILMPLNKVEAAGGFSINKGSASLTTGGTTTITISASGCAGRFTISSSNSNVAKVSTTSEWLDNSSVTVTITAVSAGTANISINAVDVVDTDLNDVTGTKTCSITVSNPAPVTPTTPSNGGSTGGGTTTTKPSTGGSTTTKPSNNGGTTTTKPKEEPKKSNDSSLKALVVEGYELYPEFNTNTHEYNIRVTNDITNLTITPTVNHEKASYKVQGATEELEVGKNVITVVVTAEDGTTTNYVINVTRNREGLNVEHIKFFYIDENGQTQEIALNPEFSAEVLEYDLGIISYLISKLDVDVLANFEEAKIEITGNENLVEGENTITITITMPSENEEETDEVLTYTIKVNKEAEPVVTFIGKIQNWFNGITGTVSVWFNENVNEILIGALGVACIALAGLSVYIVIDYKKYKLMAHKIAELTKINNAETIETNENANMKIEEKITEEEPEIKPRGRHF